MQCIKQENHKAINFIISELKENPKKILMVIIEQKLNDDNKNDDKVNAKRENDYDFQDYYDDEYLDQPYYKFRF